MLQNTLTQIPQIVLLRSDKVLLALLKSLVFKPTQVEKSRALLNGVRDFYPNRYRLDEIELSLAQEGIKKHFKNTNESSYEELKGYGLEVLEELFDAYFCFNGSKMYAKEESIDAYLKTITKVSPSMIMGYKLASLLHKQELAFEDVKRFIKNVKPLGLKVEGSEKYADNHVHLKGAGYSPFNLMMLFSKKTAKAYYEKKYVDALPRINEFSYLNNATLNIGQLVDVAKLSLECLYGSVLKEQNSSFTQNSFKNYVESVLYGTQMFVDSSTFLYKNIIEARYDFAYEANSSLEKLCNLVMEYAKEQEFIKAHLSESVFLALLFLETKSSTMQAVVKIYFQITNILRSYMLMSQNVGLAHFSEFSQSPLRSVERADAYNTAQNLSQTGNKFISAKLGLKSSSKAIARMVELFNESFEKQEEDVKLNFCLCSVKQRDRNVKSVTGFKKPQFYNLRKRVQEEAFALEDFLTNAFYKYQSRYKQALRFKGMQAYKNKKKLEKEYYDLSGFVVSLDVVGKETHTPHEVYAPFFKYLRKEPKKITHNLFKGCEELNQHPKLVASVHAGEDFNHLVSGMRAVDEVVCFYELEARDRLGHALSLGLRPHVWFKQVQEIVLTKAEYFDNLVWLSLKLEEMGIYQKEVARVYHAYKGKIHTLYRELYPSEALKEPYLRDFYKAWELRQFCPISLFEEHSMQQQYKTWPQRVLKGYEGKEENIKAYELYKAYHTNDAYAKKALEVVYIAKEEVSKEELLVWEMVQDYLLGEYAKKGLVIETNPSSNVFISTFECYSKHPIFRFYPPKEKFLKKGKKFNKYGLRQGKISVTINSDDPAIFVTSIQNEYKVLKKVAVEHYGCSEKEAREWLEEIRKEGIKLFKESHGQNNKYNFKTV